MPGGNSPKVGCHHARVTLSALNAEILLNFCSHNLVEDVAVGRFRDAAVGQLYSCRNRGRVLRIG